MPASIPKRELVLLLAAALGEEKGEELVASAARRLALGDDAYSLAEARAIFERIALTPGLVGVVARFAITRGDVDSLRAKTCVAHAKDARPPSSRDAGSPETVDLVALLSPVLGTEKAKEAIEAAAASRGLDGSMFAPSDARDVLEVLAQTDGIVGVVARFAQTRFARHGRSR
jgi:hypothetical protein